MSNANELRRFYHGMIVISRPEKSSDVDGDGWDHQLWFPGPVPGELLKTDVSYKDELGRTLYCRPIEKAGDAPTLARAIAAAKEMKAQMLAAMESPSKPVEELIEQAEQEAASEATTLEDPTELDEPAPEETNHETTEPSEK